MAQAVLGAILVAADSPEAPLEEATDRFPSHGKKVTVERFAPEGPGRRPVVVLLHGVSGIADDPPGMISPYRHAARRLAREGYLVLVPHYFDRTGTKFRNAVRNRQFFETWMETVADAVTYAGRLPGADRRRVGLLGFSLGASVALSNGAADPRVSAVVEYYGTMLADHAEQLTAMPPTLVLHGEADRNVPVREAYKLAELFTARQVPFEIHVYPGAGHGFRGDDEKDAWRRTLDFLDKHLKGP
jgi:carboxymethylenebutenolidase